MAEKNIKLKDGEDVVYPQTKIGNILNDDGTKWEVPSGDGQVFFNLFTYYDEANDKITQEGWDKLSNGLINGTYCGILYDELPLIVSGFNGARTLYTFITTEEADNVSIKITVKSDLTYTIENVHVSNIPTLPADASSKIYTLKAVNGVLTWIE